MTASSPRPAAPSWSMLRAALDPVDALRASLAAGLGALSGLACGAPPDLAALAATLLLPLLASAAWQGQAAADAAGRAGADRAAAQRDAAQLAAMAAAGVTLLLAARSGPAPLAFGLGLALIGRWQARHAAAPQAGPALHAALAAGAGIVLWVGLADAVQRHGLSRFALLAALAPALSVAGAELLGSALPLGLRRASAAVPLLLAPAWLAGWAWAQWLPTGAAWALLAAPLGWGALLPARRERARALAHAAALLQALLLAAAYARVLQLRG